MILREKNQNNFLNSHFKVSEHSASLAFKKKNFLCWGQGVNPPTPPPPFADRSALGVFIDAFSYI